MPHPAAAPAPTHGHEHPFAQYVRVLGKGPNLSRPLTQDEAHAAMGMILRGEVDPVQLGAFLCLLRVKTETPEEVAGLAQAIRDHLGNPGARVDVDWPSYAGKSRQLPYYLLAALALAQSGIRVFMHGAEGHTIGRVYTSQSLAALGIKACTSVAEAESALERHNFAYMTLEHLAPRLHQIMELRNILGLRSPIHTVARVVNPFGAAFTLGSVTHPPYLPVHQEASRLLGETAMAAFKGEGGEVERRPEKPTEVWFLQNGEAGREDWPALISGAREKQESLDLTQLKALWDGSLEAPEAEAAIAGTMAIALRYSGRADSVAAAEAAALALWRSRDRRALPGA